MRTLKFSPYRDFIESGSLVDSNVLEDGRECNRAPPDVFCTNGGFQKGHYLCNETKVEQAAVVLATFNSSCAVRGTAILKFDDDRALFPRCASEKLTRAFIDYIRSVSKIDNPDSSFYSYVDFRSFTFEDRVIERINGDVLWITADEAFNWGVWLLQVLPALALAEKHQIDATILCYAGLPWQQRFLDRFGPSYCGRQVFQNLQNEYRADGNMRTIVRTERNMYLGRFDNAVFDAISAPFILPTGSFNEKIFVTRRAQSTARPDYRVLVNEELVCSVASLLGYRIVSPETLSFDEQISVFANARCVVGVGGAGMFNAVFCKSGTPVMTIEGTDQWLEAHSNLFYSRGLHYSIFLGSQCDAGSPDPHGSWFVDVSLFELALREFDKIHGL